MTAPAARVLVVTPVRNESAYVDRLVAAMAAQTRPPERWIVVDDRSTDDTLARLSALEADVPFMTVVATAEDQVAPASADRLALAAEVRSFERGLAADDWRTYTHVMKLDGDVELPPHYFETLLARFAADPALGIAGGALDEPVKGGGMRGIAIPAHHVHGAVKCYTRECYEAIGGMPARLGWDTIDETYARMHGFKTETFFDLRSVHHRPFATADGALRGRARHGECAYIVQYSPAWVLLRSAKVARWSPVGLSGLAYLYGYFSAAVRRVPRVEDPAYRRFTRRELRARMRRAVSPR